MPVPGGYVVAFWRRWLMGSRWPCPCVVCEGLRDDLAEDVARILEAAS